MNFESQLKNEESHNFYETQEEIPQKEEILEKKYESHQKIPQFLRKEVLDAFENMEELFLGSGNYGVVLNNVEYKKSAACIKIVWEALDVFEGKNYIDDGDDYIKALKKFKNYFNEIKIKRQKMMKESGKEFAPQSSLPEEFEKMCQAHTLLKGSNIDCYIPEPYLSGFDELDDTSAMEEDGEEVKRTNVYSINKFNILVMERVEGKNLYEIGTSPQNNKEILELFLENQDNFCEELKKAVAFLNANNIKHGDLHMGNIMINNMGKPVIIDFGVNTHLHDRDDMEDVEKALREFKNKINIDK